jgi:HlyD family secretion protein
MTRISNITKKRWIWMAPALTLAILVLMGSHVLSTVSAQATAPKPGDLPEAKKEASSAVTTYTVANGDVTRIILITGELQAIRSLEVTAPITRATSSNSITFMADEGANIRQGEKLIEFDNASLVSQITDQQRMVEEAALTIEKTKVDQEASRCDQLNSVAQAEGQLKIAKLNADIPKDLLPTNTYLKYQNDFEKAKLNLAKAKDSLANFESNYEAQIKLQEIAKAQREIVLKRMQNDLAVLSVNAPQDGVVIYGDNWASNRKYQIGDMAFPGMSIMTLPDLSAMQVVGYVYDTELQYLSPGMACDIFLDAAPGKSYRGKIQSLTSVATRKGFVTTQKVFKAVMPLDSVDAATMKPGMSARAEIALSMASDVVVVPRQYISLDGQGQYYVLKETDPKKPANKETIKVGAFGDQMVQVLSGANVGDRLLPITKAAGE